MRGQKSENIFVAQTFRDETGALGPKRASVLCTSETRSRLVPSLAWDTYALRSDGYGGAENAALAGTALTALGRNPNPHRPTCGGSSPFRGEVKKRATSDRTGGRGTTPGPSERLRAELCACAGEGTEHSTVRFSRCELQWSSAAVWSWAELVGVAQRQVPAGLGVQSQAWQ